MSLFNSIRESRKRLYQQLTSNADLMSLATGGVVPITQSYSFADRTSMGPHVFYYTQSYDRDGFNRWRHRIAVEAVVPYGTYQIGADTVDAYEYSEAMQSEVMNALEPQMHGSPTPLNVVTGGLLIGDSVYVWQVIVETIVTKNS